METIDVCLELLYVHREPAMKRRVLEFCAHERRRARATADVERGAVHRAAQRRLLRAAQKSARRSRGKF